MSIPYGQIKTITLDQDFTYRVYQYLLLPKELFHFKGIKKFAQHNGRRLSKRHDFMSIHYCKSKDVLNCFKKRNRRIILQFYKFY